MSDDRVKVSHVKVRQRGGTIDPGCMYDHIETPEAVLDGVEKTGYRLLVGDVRRECRAAPPMPSDLADRRVGQVDAAGISHGDVEPVGRQLGGDNPSHTPGPPGHQRSPRAASCGTSHLGRSFPRVS